MSIWKNQGFWAPTGIAFKRKKKLYPERKIRVGGLNVTKKKIRLQELLELFKFAKYFSSNPDPTHALP